MRINSVSISETVYGRGYRFTVPIVIVTDNEPVKSTTTLAVFSLSY